MWEAEELRVEEEEAPDDGQEGEDERTDAGLATPEPSSLISSVSHFSQRKKEQSGMCESSKG